MLKKTTLVLSALFLCLSLVACGAPVATSLPDDKVATILPPALVPSGVTATQDNVSSSYFLSGLTLGELEKFYGEQFLALGTEGIVSYDADKLVELELLPAATDGNTVVWASYGQYTQEVENVESDTESSQTTQGETPQPSVAASTPTTQIVPVCVTIAQSDTETAVMVAVGAQATRMALAHKLIEKQATK